MSLPYAIVYKPPPPHLADRVSSFYEFTNPAPLHDDVERADRQQLRLQLAGSGYYEFACGRQDASHPVSLIGPTTGHIRGVSHGPTHIFGIGLLPAAWGAIIGSHTQDYVDRCVDASTLLGEGGIELWQQVGKADSFDERVDIAADFLTRITAPADAEHARLTELVDRWLTDNPDPHIDDLLAATGFGLRKLERLTKRYYGLPPKTLARKYRALRAAAAIARGEELDAVGMGDSFYDQSHLIREVKRYAGMTPQRIRDRQSRLLTEIAEGRTTLRGKVSRLISES